MSEWVAVSRDEMARRVARDIPASAVVNLGIGMPERVGNFLHPEDEVIIHTENGIIGSGPTTTGPLRDFDLINAGRKPVSLVQGGHFVDHADSFALVRGGHLDITVLGAFQVSVGGDLANWSTGEKADLPSPGGAMDLAVGARNVFVMMNLFGRNGEPKLVEQCTLPLTAATCVTRVYTDLAVFDLTASTPIVMELAPGVELDSLEARLGISLMPANDGIRRYGA